MRRRCVFLKGMWGTSSSATESIGKDLDRFAAGIGVNRRCCWQFGRFFVNRHFRLFQHNRPCVDGSELPRRIFTLQARSVQPCVRPLSAVHMTAGHNALRGSGPKRTHSTMLWPLWVVLIVGSTGSALRAVRPPNRHITPDARCDLVQAASAAGSL